MNKISTSINILKLQGAQRMQSRSGRDIIVIDVAASRLKPHNNGAVYLALDVVESRDGVDKYDNTHFVAEPVTKDERESGVKLPIIGNGKSYGDGPRQEPARQAPRTNQQRPPARQQSQGDWGGSHEGPLPDNDDDGSIPF